MREWNETAQVFIVTAAIVAAFIILVCETSSCVENTAKETKECIVECVDRITNPLECKEACRSLPR